MYTKWADKHGCKGRIIEKYPPMDGGTKSVTIDFESKYAFGYLFGERGQHRMIKSSLDGSLPHEVLIYHFLDIISKSYSMLSTKKKKKEAKVTPSADIFSSMQS